MSKQTTACLLLFFIAITTCADTYSSFYSGVKKNIGDIRVNEIEKRIAEKNYEKSMILARTDEDKTRAEIAYAAAIVKYTATSRNMHTACFTSVFDVIIAELAFTISDLGMNIAQLEYSSIKKLYDLSGSAELNINEAFITFKQKEIEQRQAGWQMNEIKKLFIDFTGIEWEPAFRDMISEYKPVSVKEKEWTDNDPAIRKAELELKLAGYLLSGLPENSSAYEKQLLVLEQEKAQILYNNAVADSVSRFRTITRQLEYLSNTLLLVKKNLSSYEEEIKDAEARYNRKIIPEKDFLGKKYNYTVLRKKYYDTLESYITSYITYITGAGKNPEEVLK